MFVACENRTKKSSVTTFEVSATFKLLITSSKSIYVNIFLVVAERPYFLFLSIQ